MLILGGIVNFTSQEWTWLKLLAVIKGIDGSGWKG
jgi:hypothetical protein